MSCPGSRLCVLKQAACISLLGRPADPYKANSLCPRTRPLQGKQHVLQTHSTGLAGNCVTTIWHLLFPFLLSTLHAGATKLQSALGGFPCSLLATMRSVYL